MRLSQHFICVVVRNAVAEHEGVQHRMPPAAGAFAPDGPKRPVSRLRGLISARRRDRWAHCPVDGFSPTNTEGRSV